MDIANEISDERTTVTNTCLNARNTNPQVQNTENLSTKEKVLFFVYNNFKYHCY